MITINQPYISHINTYQTNGSKPNNIQFQGNITSILEKWINKNKDKEQAKNTYQPTLLNKIEINPTKRPSIRESTAIHLDNVYNNYKNSLQEISISDIQKAVDNIEKTTNYSREEILATMQQATQFANMKSILQIGETLNKNNIESISNYYNFRNKNNENYLVNEFGLTATLKYLVEDKKLFKLNENNEYKAAFLDNNKLEALEKDLQQEYIKNTKNSDIKYFILSGFNNGINFLNRNKDLETTTKEILAIKDIDQETIKRANKLGLNPIIIKNTHQPTIENIYKQMRPEQMNKEELKALIDATLIYRIDDDKHIDLKDSVIQYLDNTLTVFSPEAMANNLKTMHENIKNNLIKDGKTLDNAIYCIPRRRKSFDYINYQYQLVNNLNQNKFELIGDVLDKLTDNKLQNKTIIILDDCAISGSSTVKAIAKLYAKEELLKKQNVNIIIAPMHITKDAENLVTRHFRNTKREKIDSIISANKEKNNWQKDIKSIFSLHCFLGRTIYNWDSDIDDPKPCIIFPYMAPDNNTEFGGNIGAFHSIKYDRKNPNNNTEENFHGEIKSYTDSCQEIDQIVHKFLNSQKTID